MLKSSRLRWYQVRPRVLVFAAVVLLVFPILGQTLPIGQTLSTPQPSTPSSPTPDHLEERYLLRMMQELRSMQGGRLELPPRLERQLGTRFLESVRDTAPRILPLNQVPEGSFLILDEVEETPWRLASPPESPPVVPESREEPASEDQ